MAITQPINGFTVTPLRTNPATFSADTDTYHTELAQYIAQIKNWTTQANNTQNEINATEQSVASMYKDFQNREPESGGYSQSAINQFNKEQNQANFPFSGVITNSVDEELEIDWNNSLIGTIQNRYLNFGGKLIDTYDNDLPNTTIDFTNDVPNVQVETTTTTTQAVNKGDYVVINDSVYRAIQDAPIGTLVTNTTYFEDRTVQGVTNQVMGLGKLDSNDSFTTKTELALVDYVKGMTRKGFMLANGFAEVSKGLYFKLLDSYILFGVFSTLNKGAYEPILNPYGTRGWCTTGTGSTGQTWDDVSVGTIFTLVGCFDLTVNSTYDPTVSGVAKAVDGASGSSAQTASRRIDGKAYDVVYENQFIPLWSSAKEFSDIEIEKSKAKKIKNDTYKGINWIPFSEEVTQTTTGTVATIEVSDGTKYIEGQEIQIYSDTDSINITDTIVAISNNTLTISQSILKTATDYIISGGFSDVPRYGEFYISEIISVRSNFTQLVNDRLSAGLPLNSIVYNSCSVNDGSSNIPDGVTSGKLLTEKLDSSLGWVRTSNGTTWVAVNSTNFDTYYDPVLNELENSTLDNVSNFILVQYVAKSTPLNQSDVLPIVLTDDEEVNTNSHNTGKGAMITNMLGGIATGNGARGFESKTLENSLIDENGLIDSIPEHDTPTLDNSDSKASKSFYALGRQDGRLYSCMFVQKLAKDVSDNYNSTKFDNLTNGTTLDDVGTTVKTGFFAQEEPFMRSE